MTVQQSGKSVPKAVASSHDQKRTSKRKNESTSSNALQEERLPPLKTLKGKKFAVSTRALSDQTSTSQLSYNQLKEMCIRVGAEVSSQVHKNVHAVIASVEAVEYPATKRVRKAWKLSIPVVQIQWIQNCLLQKKALPMDPYCYEEHVKETQSEDTSCCASEPSHKKAKTTIHLSSKSCEKDAPSLDTKEVDLGCCCICHDNATVQEAATDCAWCVECSVNQKYRNHAGTSPG